MPLPIPRAAKVALVPLTALALGMAACSSNGTDRAAPSTAAPTTTVAPGSEPPVGGRRPQLRPAPCPDPGIPEDQLTCEVLVLPEDRSEPDGRQVELPVLRTPATSPAPTTDQEAPVVVLHGGPGAGVVTDWALWTTVLGDLDRELVLYDQRGAGASTPRLDCPDHTEALLDALGDAASHELERVDVAASLGACHARLEVDGVDLDAYDTPTSTADLEDLRTALGAEQLTLVGSSYGTRLALDYLRRHPDRVRSLVLDGVDPPRRADAAQERSRPQDAVERLLKACSEDDHCSATRPDLPGALEAALDSFDRSPRTVTITPPDGGPERQLVLTGDDLYAGLYAALYDSTLIPLLPGLIETIERDDSLLGTVAAQVLPAMTSTATGTFMSIDCADAGPGARDVALERSDPGRASTLELVGSLPFCDRWPVEPVEAPFFELPTTTDAPAALVVSGELDPITPAADGRSIAERLGARHVEIPRGGHAPMLVDPCAQDTLRSFLTDPDGPVPDCVDALEPLPFA